ncbi:extracellular solute-binding protein [Allokutzneria sp. A3M-2-11 16]|uniref:ABC transporter substrate-binding protein n=1 Tax=Allokutzneria sp. A3M-2-11 16 TaxID=2962043 RepID=UPI0020B81270|nr:extracellular solute-binding protein [Allokutzneria sp. A3M-2-11 16]MCP3802616.1 extracellular solute-binding protein [Allokutzneria sp. A3M-2-11 16]
MDQRRSTRARALAAALTAAVLAGCSWHGDQRTTLVFFQFKTEAMQYFKDLAARFEAENPDIRVVVDNVPDAETALRTRLVKGDVPDVLTLNGNGPFGEFASAGVFADFSRDPLLRDVKPAYVEVLRALGAGSPGAVNGIPFSANASGVLYNQDLFAQHGVRVPRTWSELMSVVKAFEAKGIPPFYATRADAWTTLSPLAPLTAQTTAQSFFTERFAGRTTFEQGWREAVDKLGTLFDHTQPNPGGTGYEDGTTAFAQGKSAMLLLGSYAAPQIRSSKPKFTIGNFALPATDDAARTEFVSGVDLLVTAHADGDHPAETRRFIEFLMRPQVVQDYAEAQVAIPALKGLKNQDSVLALADEGRTSGFMDHQFIPAIPLGPLTQQYLIDRDRTRYLRGLDSTWDRVAKRRTWGLGAVRR